MGYGLNLGWGGTYGGPYEVLGGPIKGYTTNLVQGSKRNFIMGYMSYRQYFLHILIHMGSL